MTDFVIPEAQLPERVAAVIAQLEDGPPRFISAAAMARVLNVALHGEPGKFRGWSEGGEG